MADWSDRENAATVDAYFEMLIAHLDGDRLVKNDFYRRVHAEVDGSRSLKAVERKFQNVSAVLFSEFRIFIPGIAPAKNAQGSLYQAVDAYLATHPEALSAVTGRMRQDVTAEPDLAWDPPEIEAPVMAVAPESVRQFSPRQVDFIQIEASNRSLGLAGELIVLESERRRLAREGLGRLADRVEHVAHTRGDGLGYDILSFNTSGAERYLEVKTSRLGKTYPFYASRNEVDFSSLHRERFELHRLFNFASPSVGKYVLPGDLRETCNLDPVNFVAQPRAS